MAGIAERAVSARASADASEFVAEVFAGIMDGKKYDSAIMSLYEKLGGPNI